MWEERLGAEVRPAESGGAGDVRSSLKGESLTVGQGEGEGEAGCRTGGAGDLGSLAGLLSRVFSPPELCCCFACCRHFARRFLNQT